MVPTDLSDDEGRSDASSVAFGHFQVPRREDGSLWKLGEGNMGVTYRAFDTSLRTEVALKVITASRVNEDESRRRFQREARAAAKVRHPNVANVLYLGEEGGEFFYAMEFVAGYSLDALLKATGGPLPPVIAVALAAQVAAGLNAAHRREVVHRDLKPANLMLLDGEVIDQEDHRTQAAGDRQIKIIDFGLARSFSADRQDESMVTQTVSGFIGTPMYASPEQAAGESDIDGRSDLYSLGIILWQMLAGAPPFTGKVVEVMRKHLITTPPFETLPPDLPASLVDILRGLLIKEAATREPQSAGEVRNRLDACLGELTGLAPAPTSSATGSHPPVVDTGSSAASTHVMASPLLPASLPLKVPVQSLPPAPAPPAAVPFRPRKRFGPVLLGLLALALLIPGAYFGSLAYRNRQEEAARRAATDSAYERSRLEHEAFTAEQTLADSRVQWRRSLDLYGRKVTSRAEVDAAESDLHRAEEAFRMSEAALVHGGFLATATLPSLADLRAQAARERETAAPVRSAAAPTAAQAVPAASPTPRITILPDDDASPGNTPPPPAPSASLIKGRFRGEIRDGPSARATVVPVTVEVDADGLNGTITYGSRLGDTTVRFKINRDGNVLQAVTKEVIAKPERVKWDGEVFRLRFNADLSAADYECEIPKSDLRGTLKCISPSRP